MLNSTPFSGEAPGRRVRPQVALLFDPGRWRHRGTMHGINRYAQSRRGWDLLLLRYHVFSTPLADLAGNVDGIITDTSEASMAVLEGVDRPTVMLARHPQLTLPAVSHDFAAAGRMIARAFIDRGFRHLRSFTTGEEFRVDAHEAKAGFADLAAKIDPEYACFLRGPRTQHRGRWVLEDQLYDLAEWLAAAPRPVGLMAVDDEHAWRAARACSLGGLRVPEDVAIAGVGNDEYLCGSTTPTLSSVVLDHEQLGHDAAAMLDQQMAGQPPAESPRLAPVELVPRRSTDIHAVDDPLVAEALRLIWIDDEQQRPTVDQLAEVLEVSKRTLHRHFDHALGRSPGDEIRRARIELACRLITSTDLLLVEVAVRTGFSSVSQLSRDIYRHSGKRPTQLRDQVRRSHRGLFA